MLDYRVESKYDKFNLCGMRVLNFSTKDFTLKDGLSLRRTTKHL